MLTLPPVLTHAVAAGFARSLKPELFSGSAEVVADASALQQFDSSALAVLLECRRHALASGKRFSVQSAPQRLLELAVLYGVADLIPATTAAPT
ncbi:MAG: STAS domain-containing protein [Polaromonas sp.]|nr:STAS domain-containing protein [Polaromonas sp.]